MWGPQCRSPPLIEGEVGRCGLQEPAKCRYEMPLQVLCQLKESIKQGAIDDEVIHADIASIIILC